MQLCRSFDAGTSGSSLKVIIESLGLEANVPLGRSAVVTDYTKREMPAWTERCLKLPSGSYNLTFHATGQSPARVQIQNIVVNDQGCGRYPKI